MGSTKRKRDPEEEPASDTARKPKSPPKSPSEAKAFPSKQSLDDESKRLRNQLMQIQTEYVAYFGQRVQAFYADRPGRLNEFIVQLNLYVERGPEHMNPLVVVETVLHDAPELRDEFILVLQCAAGLL